MKDPAIVAAKYAYVYKTMLKSIEPLIASAVAPDKKYLGLKAQASAVWFTAIWAHSQNPPPTPEQLLADVRSKLGAILKINYRGQRTELSFADFVRAIDIKISEEALPFIRGADLVLDLGCGWGHRLVDLYRAGLDTQFVGGDQSPSSRKLVERVTGLYPHMRAQWFEFDFLNPDFSAVQGDYKDVAILTYYAIEQVTEVPPALLLKLRERFPNARLRGVHIEPISAQIDPARTWDRELVAGRKYNRNLVEMLRGLTWVDVVKAESAILEIEGQLSAALVAWETPSRIAAPEAK